MPVGSIGIFSFGIPPIERMAPERTRAFLAEAAFQKVDLCFFASGDCDLASGQVAASRWKRGAWEKTIGDLPGLVSIINNPITPGQREVNEWLRSRARIVGFRERDKLAAAALVETSPWACHVIPNHRLDPDNLEGQLAEWLAGGGIVVKPNDGMRGHGIQFVLPDGKDWIVVQGDERWRGPAGEAVARVAKAIRGRMRYREYVVQRYIESVNEIGQPITIRVDIVRRPEGGWGLVRMVGRIAAVGKMVSNAATGAASVKIAPFLAARRVRSSEEISAEALALAVGVADAVGADLGPATNYECGIDLAIDPDDRLWFIEANPLPQAIWAEHERAVLVMAYLKSLAAA